jgi:hypothetical protein
MYHFSFFLCIIFHSLCVSFLYRFFFINTMHRYSFFLCILYLHFCVSFLFLSYSLLLFLFIYSYLAFPTSIFNVFVTSSLLIMNSSGRSFQHSTHEFLPSCFLVCPCLWQVYSPFLCFYCYSLFIGSMII